MDTSIAAVEIKSDVFEDANLTSFTPALGHSTGTGGVEHVLTDDLIRRISSRAPSASTTDFRSPMPQSPRLLDGLLCNLAAPALMTVGLVRLYFRTDWSESIASRDFLGAVDIWGLVVADLALTCWIVNLWIWAWKRAHAQDSSRESNVWDLIALLVFLPVWALSSPVVSLACAAASALSTSLATLAQSTRGESRRTAIRWGEAAFATIQIGLIAVGLAAGAGFTACAVALIGASLVGFMSVLSLADADEQPASH